MAHKVLFLDIETFPLEVFSWGIYDQNLGLNQVKQDWTVAAWAAKWAGETKVHYSDVSGQKDLRDDLKTLRGIWSLMDEADIVVTQNGKAFDVKKLNARFIKHKMNPPAPFKHIDTKLLAKKTFGFTSNSLEYLCDVLGVAHKKLKHKKYPGQELWTECLKGNSEAWLEMRKYNIMDVLALEDVYARLIPWHNPVDFRLYNSVTDLCCPTCLGTKFEKRGFNYTNLGKYQRYRCTKCGTWFSSKGQRNNLLSKQTKEALKG